MKHLIYSLGLLWLVVFQTSCCDCEENVKNSEATFLDIGDQQKPADSAKVAPDKRLVNIDIDNNTDQVHYGIDISHYQGKIMEEFDPRDSLKFIICKATQGVSYIDPEFRMNWNTIQEKGFIRGAYHFYICDEEPRRQAEHFAAVIEDIGNHDIAPILDIEQGSMSTKVSEKQMEADILLFLERVYELTKRTPILYTDYAFAQEFLKNEALNKYPLWLAEYSKRPMPLVPTLWEKTGFKIWQKSDNYNAFSKSIDFDVYYGHLKTLVK